MLQLGTLANKYKKRTLRPRYTHTQATPYAATLYSSFDRTAGQLSGGGAITSSQAAIMAGSVLVKRVGEVVTLAGTTDLERAFGLSANNVGGNLDELGTRSEIGVWRGVGSIFDVLAPAFDTTSLTTHAGNEAGTDATEVYMKSSSKGVLKCESPGDATGGADAAGDIATLGAAALGRTARLIKSLSSTVIRVELLV